MRDPLRWPAGSLPPTCDQCGETLRPVFAQGILLSADVARSPGVNPLRGVISVAWCQPCQIDYVRNAAGEFEPVSPDEAIRRIPDELL